MAADDRFGLTSLDLSWSIMPFVSDSTQPSTALPDSIRKISSPCRALIPRSYRTCVQRSSFDD
jgi:hypothetical protein